MYTDKNTAAAKQEIQCVEQIPRDMLKKLYIFKTDISKYWSMVRVILWDSVFILFSNFKL